MGSTFKHSFSLFLSSSNANLNGYLANYKSLSVSNTAKYDKPTYTLFTHLRLLLLGTWYRRIEHAWRRRCWSFSQQAAPLRTSRNNSGEVGRKSNYKSLSHFHLAEIPKYERLTGFIRKLLERRRDTKIHTLNNIYFIRDKRRDGIKWANSGPSKMELSSCFVLVSFKR